MEIIQERLEREYDLDLITTAPTVIYEVEMTNGEVVYVDSPSKLPPLNNIAEIREPIAECNMLVPQEFLGMSLPFAWKNVAYKPIWCITVTKLR